MKKMKRFFFVISFLLAAFTLLAAAPKPDPFKDTDADLNALPVLAHGQLYLRDLKNLQSLEIRTELPASEDPNDRKPSSRPAIQRAAQEREHARDAPGSFCII